MSLFDYPRINIKGTISFSPSTANNDDYAGSDVLPQNWGPHAGQPLALIDSKYVEARTYGMSDAAFIAWVQKAQTFDKVGHPGKTSQIIPAEWNYYGALNSQIVDANVVGVQNSPNRVYTKRSKNLRLSAALGATLTCSGHFADVNSQGSPPATQFFIDSLTLKKGRQILISGSASKAASSWLNFYRNVNLPGDGGAGAYAYHIIKKSDAGTIINLPGLEDPNIVGVIFRYYLSRALIGGTPSQSNEQLEAIYKKKETNPAILEITGTFAPLYANEKILTAPTGRLMVANVANIQAPAGSVNNSPNGYISLAPAVLAQNGNTLTADFVGTFPDNYQAASKTNPATNNKFNFGPVSLQVSNASETATIDSVDYTDLADGDAKGWLFDFDISDNPNAQRILKDRNASFQLVQPYIGTVLDETEYYYVSNQLALYTEQFGSGTQFLNQGTTEEATISVYSRGRELRGRACPPITVWQYRSIPLEAPGNAIPIDANFGPGQPIEVDTSQPGNFLFTFSINNTNNPAPGGHPPASYATFMNPPYITNAPSISLRILPNMENFDQYYVDPNAAEPVGNSLLTFDVVYRKVLRTYYLLYPAMNLIFPLNNEKAVTKFAGAILQRTDPAIWMSINFMPRTRDMSESRRTLLQAWCRKVISKYPVK